MTFSPGQPRLRNFCRGKSKSGHVLRPGGQWPRHSQDTQQPDPDTTQAALHEEAAVRNGRKRSGLCEPDCPARRLCHTGPEPGPSEGGESMDGQSPAQWRVPGTSLALSRRKIFRNAVGVAAVGAAGIRADRGHLRPGVRRRAGHHGGARRGRPGGRGPGGCGDDRGGRLPGQRLPGDHRREPHHGQPGQPRRRAEGHLPGHAGFGRPVHPQLGQWLRVLHRPAAAHPQHDGRRRPTCSASSTTRPRASGCWPARSSGSAPRSSRRPRAPTGCSRRPAGRPARCPTPGLSSLASFSRSPRAAAGWTATGGGCAHPASRPPHRSSRYGA